MKKCDFCPWYKNNVCSNMNSRNIQKNKNYIVSCKDNLYDKSNLPRYNLNPYEYIQYIISVYKESNSLSETKIQSSINLAKKYNLIENDTLKNVENNFQKIKNNKVELVILSFTDGEEIRTVKCKTQETAYNQMKREYQSYLEQNTDNSSYINQNSAEIICDNLYHYIWKISLL